MDPSTPRPRLVILDVNETLSDLAGMRRFFAEIGLEEHEVNPWFAGVLRDGFALTLADTNPALADVARDALEVLLRRRRREGRRVDDDLDVGERMLAAFAALDPHPDVAPGLAALSAAGVRVVTLSNGSAAVAEALLERAGALEHVEAVLSVTDAPAWKPDPRAYRHALDVCGIEADHARQAMLVAVHPWDVDGAVRAGLAGAWIDRTLDRSDGLDRLSGYPACFTEPDLVATSLVDLARRLG